MNIHEYQAKNILKEFGVPVPNGVVILNKDEIENEVKKLNSKNLAIKAQIHAGGRGKAGGIKLVNNYKDLIRESNKLFNKILVTNQTGKQGKKVKRIYLEEITNIKKEFYLSCLVDRASSKIAFISSAEGGVDIEKVAKNNPEKIITIKINLSKSVSDENIKKITQKHDYIIQCQCFMIINNACLDAGRCEFFGVQSKFSDGCLVCWR